jgi:hypothetical protein
MVSDEILKIEINLHFASISYKIQSWYYKWSERCLQYL